MANREYITTLERLQQVQVAELRPMDGVLGYDDYMATAHRLQGAPDRPSLVIAFTFKIDTPMGYKAGARVVYAISQGEWADYLNDIPTYCEATPRVFVVDGAQYTTLI